MIKSEPATRIASDVFTISRATTAPRCLACGQPMRYEGKTINPANCHEGHSGLPGDQYYCGCCNAWRIIPLNPRAGIDING